jgi:hypothetical protein
VTSRDIAFSAIDGRFSTILRLVRSDQPSLNWRKAMADERNTPQDEGAEEVEAHFKGHHRSDEDAEDEVQAHFKGHHRSDEDEDDEVEAHRFSHHSPEARMEPSE